MVKKITDSDICAVSESIILRKLNSFAKIAIIFQSANILYAKSMLLDVLFILAGSTGKCKNSDLFEEFFFWS